MAKAAANPSQKSFFEKTKTIVWAIIISLIGGVPGAITLYDWIAAKPHFCFSPKALTEGMFGGKYKFLILSGGIYNSGAKPLLPSEFELKVKYKSFPDEVTFAGKAMLPDSILNSFNGSLQLFFDNSKDLVKAVRINAEDAQYGNLFFVVETTNIMKFPLQNDIEKMSIVCIDISGKSREENVDLSKRIDTKSGYVSFPQSGYERLK